MDEYNMLSAILIALEVNRSAVLETETLANILLAKGVCTKEELQFMHEKVEKVSSSIQTIDEEIKSIKDEMKELDDVDIQTHSISGIIQRKLGGEDVPRYELEAAKQMLMDALRQNNLI